MTFQNKHFIIIPGLRSEQLTEKVKEVLLSSKPENEDSVSLRCVMAADQLKSKLQRPVT